MRAARCAAAPRARERGVPCAPVGLACGAPARAWPLWHRRRLTRAVALGTRRGHFESQRRLLIAACPSADALAAGCPCAARQMPPGPRSVRASDAPAACARALACGRSRRPLADGLGPRHDVGTQASRVLMRRRGRSGAGLGIVLQRASTARAKLHGGPFRRRCVRP